MLRRMQEADDNLTLMAIELGASPNSPESTTMSPGCFAKAKDPEVSGAQKPFASLSFTDLDLYIYIINNMKALIMIIMDVPIASRK